MAYGLCLFILFAADLTLTSRRRRHIGFLDPPTLCSQQTDQLIQIQQTDQLIKISQTDPPIKISPAGHLIRAQQKEQLLKGQTHTKNGHGFMVVSGTSRLGKYL
jgi:hypothetical protein